MRTERLRRVGVLALGMTWAMHSTPSAGHELSSTGLAWDRSHPLVAAALESPSKGSPDRHHTLESAAPTLGNKQSISPLGLRGYLQAEVARTFGSPEHWSKMLVRGELSAQGRINEYVKWKLSGRLDYDAVYDLYDFYPAEVRKDQRLNIVARENFLDIAAGAWDLRVGRQQVVWGEIVGLFFADVVSAKDMRQFLLPEFDILRIPQWAARAEYAGEQFHAELLWVPAPSYDEIGKPGAEFFPLTFPTQPGFATVYLGESRPARKLSNTNYGVRLSTLQGGWDVSGFYYRSMDVSPTFHRQIILGPQPAVVFEARHDRITQFGSTLAKDFGSIVLKAETVYTRGRQFNVLRVADDNGVVPQNTLDWVLGLDFTLPADSRLNLQLFQRVFFDRDPDIPFKGRESGYSIFLTHELNEKLEAQVLYISSLDRSDWLLRPRLLWRFEKNWRLAAGVDVFHGPPLGFFGRFAHRDRVYTELRYSF